MIPKIHSGEIIFNKELFKRYVATPLNDAAMKLVNRAIKNTKETIRVFYKRNSLIRRKKSKF